ncbi:MAG: hypothetical protein NVS1B3_18000 [Candidatus Dormibacteraceae bacterium]
MKYATATAFRTALEQRLLNRSRESGISLVRLRKSVVFDRLLARLVVVAPDRWVLKGALALDYRLGPGTRTTMDVDLGRSDDERTATEDFIKAQAADLDDFFVFAVERTTRLDELQEGVAVRYHLDAELGGRTFEAIIVDVAFTDSIADPETLRGPEILSFAGIDPVEVPAIRLTQHIAEKFHAYSKVYGAQGVQSTRVKDLVDLVLIATSAAVDAAELRAALSRTFKSRGGRQLPAEVPPPPNAWRVPHAKTAGEIGLPTDLGAAHGVAAAFLDPVLTGRVTAGAWEPASQSWR